MTMCRQCSSEAGYLPYTQKTQSANSSQASRFQALNASMDVHSPMAINNIPIGAARFRCCLNIMILPHTTHPRFTQRQHSDLSVCILFFGLLPQPDWLIKTISIDKCCYKSDLIASNVARLCGWHGLCTSSYTHVSDRRRQ